MLSVILHNTSGHRIGTASIPPARAFPKLVAVHVKDGADRVFVRRGENIGADSDVFDEVKPVVAMFDPNGDS